MNEKIVKYSINTGLLFFGIVMIFSGFLIQINFHLGHHGPISSDTLVWGIKYSGWSLIHKITILIITLLMVFHISHHWKWYKSIIRKRFISRKRQVIILSILFIIVAITGYIPWIIKLFHGNETYRKTLIEIHDKLAIFLFIYLVIHVIKRIRWFFTVLKA